MPSRSDNRNKRVLSGMRSTGKLHLGNYVGALDNWVRMQDKYDCFFMVADWHALTTDYADTSSIKENSLEVVLDWLAAGLDPERCTDRKSTRLNSSHPSISYAVFCLKKKIPS